MRALGALTFLARTAVIMAVVFGSVVAAGYAGLEIWDATHPPVIPGWVAAPGAKSLHPVELPTHHV